jgi:PAS domain S-box-containing protein
VERKLIATAAEARFKEAIEQAPLVAVQGYDREGRVTYWNRASEDLYGFKREEALGKTVEELILEEDAAERFQAELQKVWAEANPSPSQEWLAHDRWGKGRWVYSTMFPIVIEGRCTEVFCMDLDITSRKELEAELRARNEDLEAFAHTVSHDLCVPLASLNGYANLVREAAEGKLGTEEIGYLDRILKASRSMEKLIASVLEFARSGRGVQNRERVNLEDLVREIWMEYQDMVEKRDARLEISFSRPEVIGDTVLLKQALVNLVENALKFSAGSPAPLVEMGSNEQGGEVTVFVRDNGPGIPAGEREAIFEPFKRLSHSSPGLGIGLSTVRRAVESWGGHVWVESSPGTGSAFYFTIPK